METCYLFRRGRDLAAGGYVESYIAIEIELLPPPAKNGMCFAPSVFLMRSTDYSCQILEVS